jgi:DNA-binding protein H-NS
MRSALRMTAIEFRKVTSMKSNRKNIAARRGGGTVHASDAQLADMSVKELRELKERIEEIILTRRQIERTSLRQQFREIAEAAGYTLDEIVGEPVKAAKGGKVAPKFANPSNPQETWSGRGRAPRWLAAKLQDGAKLDDFRL